MREVRAAVSGFIACQPVAYRTPDHQHDFTALPEFPLALDPLQLTRGEMAAYATAARDIGIDYIGSCCGSVACHVAAMAKALGKRSRRGARVALAQRQADVGLRALQARRLRRRDRRSLLKRDYDTIVLGLGGIGSGALYWLSRRLGGDILGLEQHALGHDRGGSQDHSRIIRYSYHRPIYVRLAARAYRAWATVEEETGESLVHRCGGLDLFPERGTIPADDYTSSLDECGVPYDRLDASEIRRRWPAFILPDSVWGLFQADGGLVAAAKANAAHARAAREHGAAWRENAPVSALRVAGGEVEVTAGGIAYRARRLILSAGAWTNGALAHFGLQLPLTVTREQVVYYAAPDLAPFALDRFPVWIWMDEPCFYGFPVFGEAAVKIAEDVGGQETTAETRSFEPDAAGLERVRNFCGAHLPGALGPVARVKTCLYTLTPDRDFVIDALPEHPEILIAIGAGHAFKFASALGQVLSELALDGRSDADLSAFSFGRPILHQADPPKSFFV